MLKGVFDVCFDLTDGGMDFAQNDRFISKAADFCDSVLSRMTMFQDSINSSSQRVELVSL